MVKKLFKNFCQNNKGFSIFEMLIYIGITGIIIGFSIPTIYLVILSSERIQNQEILIANQRFVSQKMDWLLVNVSAVNSPAAGATSSTLSINKPNFSGNPLIVNLQDGKVMLKIGAQTALPLTNSYVTANDLVFSNIDMGDQKAVNVSLEISNGATSTKINKLIFIK